MENIEKNIGLADLNWFRTGGAAEYFCHPSSQEELASALAFARKNSLPVTVMGEGANCLIADAGVKGLVIRPANQEFAVLEGGERPLVRLGAGLGMQEAIDRCLEICFLGLEELAGLPGTVGGAAFINAHFFEFFLADFLEGATVCDLNGNFQKVERDWFQYGYDKSRLQMESWIVWSADMRLKAATELETAFAKGRSFEIQRQRSRRYPLERTCGSFFRNFLPEEVPAPEGAKKIVSVAYYLDKLGVKGALASGGAKVSHKHANMLETREGANSSDVVALGRKLQEMVKKEYGLLPMPECRFLGFENFPLHTAEDFR